MLLFVFAVIIFHAPLSVYLGQFFQPELVKAWKEALLLVVIPLVLYLLWRAKLLRKFSSDLLLQLIVVYAGLHFVLLFAVPTNSYQRLAGLSIDLRYLLFFVLVFSVIVLQPSLRKLFVKVATISGSISLFFATLQATILPSDILKYLGYSKDTIAPYLTVDKNDNFIRINGTFRGPNPLGAYAVLFLSLVSAFVIKKQRTFLKYKWQISALALFAIVALWASYSRSALLALLISFGVIVLVALSRKIEIRYWFSFVVIVVVIVGSLFASRDSSFVQNVVLHNNPKDGSAVDSNDGHADSLSAGLEKAIHQPYGGGIGSAGSASLQSDSPNIIENQYLFIAQEVGWLGLGLFIVIFELIMWRLYQSRRDWLSLGVFASGIGLAFIGFLLPVWADDTVSLVWFGLAAVALGSHYKVGSKK
ncbi:O-antigen ligase family protein [Candidatus Saccharibacteria bacterium]|nr:O-antigen ligase family protein [Candidatus Saccharibacteria bacterium]